MILALLEFARTLLEAVSASAIVLSVSPGPYRSWRILCAVFGAGLVFSLITNFSGWIPGEFSLLWVRLAVGIGSAIGVLALIHSSSEDGDLRLSCRIIVISGALFGLIYSALAAIKAPHLAAHLTGSLINVSGYVLLSAGASFLLMLLLSIWRTRLWSPVFFSILPMVLLTNMWQLLPLIGALLFGASLGDDVSRAAREGVMRRFARVLLITLSLAGVILVNTWMWLISNDLLGSSGMFPSAEIEIHGLSVLLSIPFFFGHGCICREFRAE